jgi:dihydrofolate reductase
MKTNRRVILYIAASIDGYIAMPGDDLSFLNGVQKEGEDYGYAEFVDSVDTVILGRKTYDWVMTQVEEFPHANKTTYVITRREKSAVGKTQFYSGDLKALISKLKKEEGKNIFIDGGAEVVTLLLSEHLIDEFIISFIPVFVGSGTRLFKDGRPGEHLELISTKHFDTGLVQLHYKTKQR